MQVRLNLVTNLSMKMIHKMDVRKEHEAQEFKKDFHRVEEFSVLNVILVGHWKSEVYFCVLLDATPKRRMPLKTSQNIIRLQIDCLTVRH